MRLHLIRHAHAVTEEEDPQRPLSASGRAAARRIGELLRAGAGFRPAQLWHSPLVRARETAEILAGTLASEALLVETPDLLPEDDPAGIAGRLAEYPQTHDLGLVGHEPHLSALATLLLRGKPSPVLFNLKKGAIITLEPASGVHKKDGRPRWRTRWHFSPEMIEDATARK